MLRVFLKQKIPHGLNQNLLSNFEIYELFIGKIVAYIEYFLGFSCIFLPLFQSKIKVEKATNYFLLLFTVPVHQFIK